MNKKIIQILVCTACSLGIASSIPFIVTSCGSSTSEKEVPLPDTVYDIDKTTGILKGFTSEFLNNHDEYNNYNTLVITNTIKTISDKAFFDQTFCKSTIPTYIKNIVFEDGDINSLTIGSYAFRICPCEKLVLTKRIKSMSTYSFANLDHCKSIEFNGPVNWFYNKSFEINLDQFASWRDGGEISVINGFEGQALFVKNKLKESSGQYTQNFDTWVAKDVNPQNPDPDPFNEVDLPDEVYAYGDTNKTILTGFTDNFLNNTDEYQNCNTLFIPKNVVNIAKNAFKSKYFTSTIPNYIENIVFQEGDNNLSVGEYSFAYGQFKRVVCARIHSIADYAFAYCDKCQSIKFNGDTTWLSETTSADEQEFSGWNKKGTIYCKDPTPDDTKPYGAGLAKLILENFGTDRDPVYSTNALVNWNINDWYSK